MPCACSTGGIASSALAAPSCSCLEVKVVKASAAFLCFPLTPPAAREDAGRPLQTTLQGSPQIKASALQTNSFQQAPSTGETHQRQQKLLTGMAERSLGKLWSAREGYRAHASSGLFMSRAQVFMNSWASVLI